MNPLDPITTFMVGLIGGTVAATILCVVWTKPVMKLIRAELRLSQLDLRDVEITVNVNVKGEDFEGTSNVHWGGEEIAGIAVDKWLEQRGLIAQPRGVDFKVKQRPGATEGQA